MESTVTGEPCHACEKQETTDEHSRCGRGTLPLYHIHSTKVPEYMKDNPYIYAGYRAQYTTMMCLRSFLAVHNESLNVWTHAFGFVVFVLLSILLFTNVVLAREYVWHCVVYGGFSFACLMCMLCSTVYHLFMCHENEAVSLFVELVDYHGISVLIVASYIPLLYIGFACKPYYRAIYMVSIIMFGTLSVVFSSLPSLRDAKYRWIRTTVYVLMAVGGIVPLLHFYAFTPHNTESMMPLKGVALMFALYGAGVLFYTSRIPERWFPGRFDIYLSSHQIWHVFVLAAACVHFFSCTALYQQWLVSRHIC
ncbi:adiponectin receptor protein 1 [Trypanosoma brucei equiperdum]|uniref:Adiponectin receptor protein 1 n=1 Tax=Trypanosoma brucei equiperdum TaxID=630700 RepID=A0A3L6KZ05_9TRYP|nr:adiponectin receptor protein 1 [Trypanosoma brucei equiperdum]